MNKRPLITITLISLAALAMLAGLAFSEPMDIPEGSRCAECGMAVDPASVFSAEMVQGGEMLAFCDIGDMLYYYNKQEEKPTELYVRDFKSEAWIDAAKATYVKSKEFDTPMSWGIAAFSYREEAASHGDTMTFEEALASLGGGMKGMKMKGKM